MKWRSFFCLLVLMVASVSGCASWSQDPSDSTITAVFTDALPIVAGNYVRAAGVQVGLVDSVNLVNGKAQIVMKLNQPIQLHQDAQALITANNLLGEKYVEIKNGSLAAPLMSKPYLIPVSQTRSRVDVEDVVNSVDDPSGKALGLMLTSLGDGLDGKGARAAAAIAQLQPSMQQVQGLAKVLDDNNQLLTQLIDHVQPVTSALEGNQGRELDGLVNTTITTLSAVADERLAAEQTIRELPGTLGQARERLAQLAGLSYPTADTLHSLRPFSDQVRDISSELRDFSDAADPALAALRPVLDRGTEMLRQAAPVVRALRQGGDGLRGTARSAAQLTPNVLGDNLTQLMEFMKGWSLATSDYDAVSHYFKAIVIAPPGELGEGAAGPLGAAPQEPLAGLPVPTPPRPVLPGRHGGDSSAGRDFPRPTSGRNAPGGSATGLTQGQEGSMVTQMLGGN
ncbi:MAG TPA: MlaD family protein [Pseudonocardia sp.]|jgi:phospholipid/cholesterol/gamma-HCH transport system substrate-binding protein